MTEPEPKEESETPSIFKRLQQISHVTIHCAICINQGQQTPAFTVIKKFAVCEKHVPLASHPEFDIYSLVGKKKKAV